MLSLYFTVESQAQDHKAGLQATLRRSSIPDHRIAELSFSDEKIAVPFVASENRLRPMVEIKGRLSDPHAELVILEGNSSHLVKSPGNFSIFIFLNSNVSSMVFQMRKSDRKVKNEKIFILSPGVKDHYLASHSGELMVYLGQGTFRYFQNNFGSYSSSSMVFSAGYQNQIGKSQFSYSADLDFTLWNIKTSPQNASPQVLRVQGQAEYHFLGSGAFEINPLVGAQYFTMFSNGSRYGFSNLIAPEIGFKANYRLRNENALRLRFLYLPLDSFTQTSKIGTDTSITWSKRLKNEHRVEVGLAYWNEQFSPSPTAQVKTSMLSLKLGYSL